MNKPPKVSFQLEQEYIDKIKKVAKEKGITMSGYIRMIVLEKLKEESES